MSFFAILAVSSVVLPIELQQNKEFNSLMQVETFGPLVVEIVISCSLSTLKGKGYGIISYSNVDQLFCTPAHHCFKKLDEAREETCNF